MDVLLNFVPAFYDLDVSPPPSRQRTSINRKASVEVTRESSVSSRSPVRNRGASKAASVCSIQRGSIKDRIELRVGIHRAEDDSGDRIAELLNTPNPITGHTALYAAALYPS